MTLPNPSPGDPIAADDIDQIVAHLTGGSGKTDAYHFRQSSGNMLVTLPDAAGATKFRVNDSANAEIWSVDSDGNVTTGGTFSPATIILPGSASPSPTTDGSIVWDTDDNNLAIGDGASTQLFFTDNKGSDLASASTLTTTGHFHHVTGTTTITAIASRPAGVEVILYFVSACPLTYNATSLILTQAKSRTTVAGEILRFMSEGSGNWREITTNPTTGYASLVSDQSVTSSTTFVDITAVTVPIVASGVYAIEAVIPYIAGTTGDLKLQIVGPLNCTMAMYGTGPLITTGVITTVQGVSADISGGASMGQWEGVVSPGSLVRLAGIVKNSSSAGSVKLQFAQNTSNGTATTIGAGAYLNLVRLS